MITNTAKDDVNPQWLMGGNPNAIEQQEAQGQEELVASELLPSQGDWEGLEKLGIKRGDPVEGDSLFVHAHLPDGWTKRPTDHSMWSELVDEKGIKRASIFYKAAFYDRSAQIHVSTSS